MSAKQPSVTQPRPRNNTNSYRKRPRDRRRMSEFITKRSVNGDRLNPGPNPPSVGYQNWNNQILIKIFKSEWNPTPYDIAKALRAQLDPNRTGLVTSEDFRIQFKIDSIRGWNITGRSIALSINDFVDSTASADTGERDQICGIVDTGSENHTPAVGYQLPHHLKTMVLRNDGLQRTWKVCHFTAGSNDNCVSYVNLHWRFDGPSKAPQFDQTMYSLLKDLTRSNRAIGQINSQGFDDIHRVIDNATSKNFISRVVDGASKVLPVVASVGVGDGVDSQFQQDLFNKLDILTNQIKRLMPSQYEVIDGDEDVDSFGTVSVNDST